MTRMRQSAGLLTLMSCSTLLAGPVFAADPGPNAQAAQVIQSGSSSMPAATQIAQAASSPSPDASGAQRGVEVSIDPAVDASAVQMAQAVPSTTATSPSSATGPIQAAPPLGGSPAGGGGLGAYTIPPPPQRINPNAEADQYKIRGWIVPLPSAADTVDQGAFGLRKDLADLGISYLGFTDDTFEDNLLRHALPPGNAFGPHSRDLQGYNGQLPTYDLDNAFFVQYDLQRYGIPDGQISLGMFFVSTDWQPNGPNGIGVSELSYYQTLFHKRVEIKFGELSNNLEFLGTQVGGNLASGIFGDNAAVPFENGQNLGGFPSYGLNVKTNFTRFFYDKIGVQRALSPDGVQAERLQNPSGVRFVVPNSGVFVIDEIGYRQPPAPGQMATWLRGAVNYTSSRYTDITTGLKHQGNFGLYILADRQLFQLAPNAGPGSAIRGVFAGVSVMYAPSYFNIFSQYYEGRIYAFGLIPGRPFDLISAVANQNVFSDDAVRLAGGFGELVHKNANTYTIAYSAHVLPGVNLNFGVGYTDHPTVVTYTRSTGSDLNILLNLFTWF